MIIRTIVIDDEPSGAKSLSLLLGTEFKEVIEVTATTSSPFDGKKLIEELSPDLVFLSIEMHSMSGIDLLRSFTNPDFRVVFVTAHDSYALEAFRLSAFDYLLKPVEAADIKRVIQKFRKDTDIDLDAILPQLLHLEQLLTRNVTIKSKIEISTSDKIMFVDIKDIMYCEAQGSYSNVYFRDGKKIITTKSLVDFELQLAGQKFFRIHNSSLVNLKHIKEFQRHDGGHVVMENGKRLEVSQRKRKDFLEAIHDIAV